MSVKDKEGGPLDNKKEYNFLTTKKLREERTTIQKIRNVVAMGLSLSKIS